MKGQKEWCIIDVDVVILRNSIRLQRVAHACRKGAINTILTGSNVFMTVILRLLPLAKFRQLTPWTFELLTCLQQMRLACQRIHG